MNAIEAYNDWVHETCLKADRAVSGAFTLAEKLNNSEKAMNPVPSITPEYALCNIHQN